MEETIQETQSKRTRWTENEWRSNFAEIESVGISGAKWCRSKGIPYSRFIYWKKRLSNGGDNNSAPAFVEIGGASSAIVIEIAGARIHVVRGFDPVLLAGVVAALGNSVSDIRV